MMMTGYDEKSKCGYSTQFGSQWRKQMNSSDLRSRNNVGNREKRTTNSEGLGRPLTLNLTAWIGELCGFRATNYDNILPLCIWH